MPSLLTGNSTAAGTTGSTGSSSRSSRSDGSSGSGFDQMLQGGGNTPAAKTASTPSKPANKASNADAGNADARTPPASSTDATDPDAATTEVAAGTTDTPAPATDKDAATDSDDAPWPPLGLAGLALMVPPVADPSAPALPTATGTDADALPSAAPAALATLPAAATTATPATAPAATGVATTTTAADADGEAIELPLPGTVLAQTALDGADDADSLFGSDRSMTAPLQVALPAALQDLKAALASTPVFNGEPTPTPVLGDDGFDQAIGARVGWLADQKIGHAHITLNPEDLGPVDVRLQMNGDKVHASFSSPHVDVRQALESSLPRLRELLGEQGFQLAHADVGHRNSGDGGTSGQSTGSGNGRIGDGEPSLGDTTVSAAQLIRQRGLLDAYA
ncbi:flagellar hook-length control protein FliK [Stenotrophomonas sp. S48]|uniref:flagellar hook-length control protein FliK n=1 Tax=unclassified Stenotrophomonas TaxID=196198 RepID=UPI0019002734|nr:MULTISPECIES: flagellar hook-length control protein FliK [unclassified Stenotrophomonas]MBK0028294.1 flagellar hook-length control protein FliK [Stenotrophomonas sp. S48]MBK0047449.1 flagellar hook-length control protein FliK [Stenotrophomonas sp. S49]